MNKQQLTKNIGRHVRLRPPATTSDGRRLDDDWRILEVTDTRVELERIGDDASLRLGIDHVNRYSSDPQRDDANTPTYSPALLAEAKEQYGSIGHLEREAIRQLLLVGQMTDAQVEKHLSKKDLAHGPQSILQGLSNRTTLVLRAVPEQHGERLHGYKGPYVINPVFKDALEDVIGASP